MKLVKSSIACRKFKTNAMNAKISAVSSLADICFLHLLIWLITCVILSVCVSGIFGVKYFAYSYISVLFIRIRPSGL